MEDSMEDAALLAAKNSRPRRKHRNSRNGCPNCKKRRVKCSEDLPSCLNCLKHKVRCGYLDYPEEQLQIVRLSKMFNTPNQIVLQNQGFHNLNNSVPGGVGFLQHASSTNNSGINSNNSKTNSASISSHSGGYANQLNMNPSYYNHEIMPDYQANSNYSMNHMNHIHQINEGSQADSLANQLTETFDNSIANSNFITQNYANLVPKNFPSIIYPIYTIQSNTFDEYYGPETNPSSGLLPSSAPTSLSSASSNNQNHNILLQSQSHYNSSFSSSFAPIDNIIEFPSFDPAISQTTTIRPKENPTGNKILPNGIVNPTSFNHIGKPSINLKLKFENFLKNFNNDYSKGKYNLGQVRCIYIYFLESLIYQASNPKYNSELILNTILNLATNYLISNCLNHKYIANENLSISDNQFTRQSLLKKSIRYYSTTIRLLREGLLSNIDSESCSSTSYILSLMSIYDPEATLASFNCFKEGLFSILEHYIYLSKNLKLNSELNDLTITKEDDNSIESKRNSDFITGKGELSILIPIHYELMKNILKSFLYIGYDPAFLLEYSKFLIKFGNILSDLSKMRKPMKDSLLVHSVETKYAKLYNFTMDLITNLLPELNKILLEKRSNPSLIKEEEKIIFQMLHRWSVMVPSEVNTMNENSNPMMRLLCIFYKALSKSLCGIIPQSKFFFLKDFESPIMLDTFDMGHKEIFFRVSIDDYIGKENLSKLPAAEKFKIEQELKIITGYLLRLINFFAIRTSILYKHLIIDLNQQKIFTKVDNMAEIRKEILDLKNDNQNFGILEQPITKFSTTIIKPCHYPHKLDSSSNDGETPIEKGAVTEIIDNISSNLLNFDLQREKDTLMTPDSIASLQSSYSPESASPSVSLSSNSKYDNDKALVSFLNMNYQTGLLQSDFNPIDGTGAASLPDGNAAPNTLEHDNQNVIDKDNSEARSAYDDDIYEDPYEDYDERDDRDADDSDNFNFNNVVDEDINNELRKQIDEQFFELS